MTKSQPQKLVTNIERREMQGLRNAGWAALDIALAYDRSESTVYRHTKPKLSRAGLQDRNVRIAALVAQTAKGQREQREIIARRHGLSSVGSLNATLCTFRRKQRQQSGAQA